MIAKVMEQKGKQYKVIFGIDAMHLRGMLSFSLDDIDGGIIINDEGMSGVNNAIALKLLKQIGAELKLQPGKTEWTVNIH